MKEPTLSSIWIFQSIYSSIKPCLALWVGPAKYEARSYTLIWVAVTGFDSIAIVLMYTKRYGFWIMVTFFQLSKKGPYNEHLFRFQSAASPKTQQVQVERQMWSVIHQDWQSPLCRSWRSMTNSQKSASMRAEAELVAPFARPATLLPRILGEYDLKCQREAPL